MKVCKKCGLSKELAEFSKKVNGLQPNCKPCSKEMAQFYRDTYTCEEKAEIKRKKAIYLQENKEWLYPKHAKYIAENPSINKRLQEKYQREGRYVGKYQDYHKRWYSKNRHKAYANGAMRRGLKEQATPKWLTPEQKLQIEYIYKYSSELTRIFGIKYQVDHIEPIKGDGFVGLTVPWNLQILTALENQRKGNKLIYEK